MKASELRIGNYYTDICGSPSRWKSKHLEYYKSIKVKLSELKPIPLTEEWLLKFGFRNEKESEDLYELNGIYICLGSFRNLLTGTRLLYVHLLQNFYFDLTGEELTTK